MTMESGSRHPQARIAQGGEPDVHARQDRSSGGWVPPKSKDTPMDRYGWAVYVAEVHRQAGFVRLATADLEDLLSRTDAPSDRFWYSLQAALIALGNISKLLWPPEKKLAWRGETLRALLGVSADSPLKDRALRNQLEHFDEHVAAWASAERPEPATDDFLGPTSLFPDAQQFYRSFQRDSWTVGFQDRRLSLRPSVEAAARLEQVAYARGYQLVHGDLTNEALARIVAAAATH
jgi:hypothetical protein